MQINEPCDRVGGRGSTVLSEPYRHAVQPQAVGEARLELQRAVEVGASAVIHGQALSDAVTHPLCAAQVRICSLPTTKPQSHLVGRSAARRR